jgi:16S rRNA (adenine1518-N6/adenine1519-N6)-dimethyltransferase
LAPRVRRIVAVEVDRALAAALARQLPGNVHLVNDDFLSVDLDDLLRHEQHPIRVVGNLPYNISSPILFRLLDAAADGARFSDATIMLQREVADRLAAKPGTAAYGTLTLQTGLVADVEPLLTLPPGAFRPAPQVTSALIRLTFRPPRVEVHRPVFTRIARGIFVHRRKTLLNALRPMSAALGRSAEELITRADLDPSQRPQTLTVADVARLSMAVL